IDYHALRRHWHNHVSAEGRAAYVAGPGAAKDQLEEIVAARGPAARELRDCGRLTGELQRGPLLNVQNNILVNPDYTAAIARIVGAVAPYPEAREAVIAALRDLDAGSASGPALPDHRDEGAENG